MNPQCFKWDTIFLFLINETISYDETSEPRDKYQMYNTEKGSKNYQEALCNSNSLKLLNSHRKKVIDLFSKAPEAGQEVIGESLSRRNPT